MIQTTIGQLLVNDALPEEYRDHNRVMTKDAVDAMLALVMKKYPERYKDITHKLVQLGGDASFEEGTTLKLSTLTPPFDKTEYIQHIEQQERRIDKDKTLTPDEKEKARILVYGEMQKFLTDETYKQSLAQGNPFALQVKSKARGGPVQLTAILTTPSVFSDSKDRTIPVFVKRSYTEGLDPHEYWAAMYGARKSTISTKFATRDAGALGKQLGVAVSSLVVTQDDCGTPYGIPVKVDDNDNLGSVLARKTGEFPSGTVVDKNVLASLQKQKVDNIVVRSPITCNLPEGVCKQCVGLRDHGTFPPIGHHLGYNAAAALAEQIAQNQLNQKHSGGQTHGGKVIYAGFDVINSLAQVPKTFPNRASVAELDGKVNRIEPAPQGGTNVYINDQLHYVSPEMALQVKEGDKVEQGDQLSDGIVNPAEAVKYKGIGEGRRYFAERFTQAFRDSKLGVNRRNVEALARAAVDHVAINEPGGLGDFLPGDIVKYNALAFSYKPRKDAKMLEPKRAVGQYLEAPALHYTIGTRITNKVADQLKQFDVDSVMAHPQPLGFVPNMVSITKAPQYEDDWMARLGSTYLGTRLLQDVHRGATSQAHGLNPLPGIAMGTEFGQPKGKEFTY